MTISTSRQPFLTHSKHLQSCGWSTAELLRTWFGSDLYIKVQNDFTPLQEARQNLARLLSVAYGDIKRRICVSASLFDGAKYDLA
jgi:hypothetical protein